MAAGELELEKVSRLFYAPVGRLRLEHEGQCYLECRPAWASPLSYPGQYLALLDGRGREILMYKDPGTEMDPAMWEVVQEELKQRYLNGVIHRVLDSKTEFGSTYWTVVTDRGTREFVTQSLQENAQWLSPNYLLLIDVDGNRFELPDIAGMDERSRKILALTV